MTAIIASHKRHLKPRPLCQILLIIRGEDAVNGSWRCCQFHETVRWAINMFRCGSLLQGLDKVDKLGGDHATVRCWSSCWAFRVLGGVQACLVYNLLNIDSLGTVETDKIDSTKVRNQSVRVRVNVTNSHDWKSLKLTL